MNIKEKGVRLRAKSTSDLTEALMRAPTVDDYLRENRAELTGRELTDLLSPLLRGSGLSKASIARAAGMSDVYFHQIFSGRRRPTRDRLLCLCIALHATREETRALLRRNGCAPLDPRDRRDAIVLYGLIRGQDLDALNDELFTHGEKALS